MKVCWVQHGCGGRRGGRTTVFSVGMSCFPAPASGSRAPGPVLLGPAARRLSHAVRSSAATSLVAWSGTAEKKTNHKYSTAKIQVASQAGISTAFASSDIVFCG